MTAILLRATLLVSALVLAEACSRREPALEPYRLFDVVASEVRALEARVPSTDPAPPTPAAPEIRERVAGLAEALASTDARVRSIALEDARTLDAAALSGAALLLADEAETPLARDGAARILGEHPGLVAGEALCAALERSREPSVRRQCAFQLARAGDPHLWPRLLLRLRYETDGETVVWVAHTLAQRGNLSGVEGLRVLVRTATDETVRALALQVGSDLSREFAAPDLDTLASSWSSGEFESSREPVPVDDGLRLEGWRRIARLSVFDLRQVDDARFVLVDLDAWIVPHLAAALHDSNAYTRVHAAQCLERRGSRARAAIDALVDALREPVVAPSAAAALGALADPRGVPPLVDRLEGSRSLELRVAAARALGRLRALAGEGALVRAFAAGEPVDLRQAAAEGLLDLDGRSTAFDHLVELLRENRGDVDGAEAAVGRALDARSARDEAARELLRQWQALDVRAGDIATVAETETRRAARLRLLAKP